MFIITVVTFIYIYFWVAFLNERSFLPNIKSHKTPKFLFYRMISFSMMRTKPTCFAKLLEIYSLQDVPSFLSRRSSFLISNCLFAQKARHFSRKKESLLLTSIALFREAHQNLKEDDKQEVLEERRIVLVKLELYMKFFNLCLDFS